MARRMERMKPLGIMFQIPAILVLESKCTLKAYYGGDIRAGMVLIREGIYLGSVGLYWHIVYSICDWAGWTKLREFMPGSPHKIRHGGKCNYLNCDDSHCIDKSIPRWYRKFTGMDRV